MSGSLFTLIVLGAAITVAFLRYAWLTSATGAAVLAGLTWLALVGKVVAFTYPPQAMILLEMNADPMSFILGLNLWGPRYLLSYPAVLLRNVFGFTLDSGYTLYAAGLLLVWQVLLARLVLRTLRGRVAVGPLLRVALVASVGVQLLVIAAAMNGRLVPAFLGMTILLDAQVATREDGRRRLGRLVLGIFLTMMSSGTMMVGLAQVVVMTGANALQDGRRLVRTVVTFATMGVLGAVLVFPVIAEGVAKNLEYYDGSVLNMLRHGAGQLILIPDILIVTELVLIAGSTVIGMLWAATAIRRAWPSLDPLLVSIPLAVVLGLFGYSTLLMLLPALVALVTLAALQIAVRTRVAVPSPPPTSASP